MVHVATYIANWRRSCHWEAREGALQTRREKMDYAELSIVDPDRQD